MSYGEIAYGQPYGSSSAQSDPQIDVPGIASRERFGATQLIGPRAIAPTGIAPGDVGVPTINGAGLPIFIAPLGIRSAERFGGVGLARSDVLFIVPAGFENAAALGEPTVTHTGTHVISPAGIP